MTRHCTAAGRGRGAGGSAAAIHRRARPGVVLLEVVLALALFFMASLVVLAGLNASLRTAQRVQLEAQAADLAVSLLSEAQMGLLPLVSDGPNAYEEEDLAGWTWEILAEPVEETITGLALPEFLRVEIVIRHQETGYAYNLVELMTNEAPGGRPEEDLPPEEGGP